MRLGGLALRAGLLGGVAPTARLRHGILSGNRVDLVIDGGASVGIYGYRLRACGYRGRIVSFEPLAGPYAELEALAAGDGLWECRRLALGASPDPAARINVTANSVSSSLLPVGERHIEAAPGSVVAGTETVSVATLDDLAPELPGAGAGAYLKLDLQGYELEALRGAEGLLGGLTAVEAEVSLVELYDGAPGPGELIDHLAERGFECVGLFPGFTDREGRTLQADALFERR